MRHPCTVGAVNLSSDLRNLLTFSEVKGNRNKCGGGKCVAEEIGQIGITTEFSESEDP